MTIALLRMCAASYVVCYSCCCRCAVLDAACKLSLGCSFAARLIPLRSQSPPVNVRLAVYGNLDPAFPRQQSSSALPFHVLLECRSQLSVGILHYSGCKELTMLRAVPKPTAPTRKLVAPYLVASRGVICRAVHASSSRGSHENPLVRMSCLSQTQRAEQTGYPQKQCTSNNATKGSTWTTSKVENQRSQKSHRRS